MRLLLEYVYGSTPQVSETTQQLTRSPGAPRLRYRPPQLVRETNFAPPFLPVAANSRGIAVILSGFRCGRLCFSP